jgi:hypothetical protein
VFSETLALNTKEMRLQKMRQGVITSARLLSEQMEEKTGSFRGRWVMVTLTYGSTHRWRQNHIREYLQRVRMWFHRHGVPCCYLWVMELHTGEGKNHGIPHYHVLFFVPKSLQMPKADKKGWWAHGWTTTEQVRNAVGYMAKYASKGHPKLMFPKRARIHGCAGLDKTRCQERRWWSMPSYVREAFPLGCDVSRTRGGGFVDRATGCWMPSQWEIVLAMSGAVWLRRKTARLPDLLNQ